MGPIRSISYHAKKKDDIIVHNQYRGATTTKNSIEWKKNQTESTIVTH
jgi:hypothetical protein